MIAEPTSNLAKKAINDATLYEIKKPTGNSFQSTRQYDNHLKRHRDVIELMELAKKKKEGVSGRIPWKKVSNYKQLNCRLNYIAHTIKII